MAPIAYDVIYTKEEEGGFQASRIQRVVFFLGAALLSGIAVEAQQVPLFVVVHPDNEMDMMSREMVSSIYLKKVTKWSDGTLIEAIDLDSSSSIRKIFFREIVGMELADVQAFWEEKTASDGIGPWPLANNDAAVVEYVRKRPGGIGFVSTSSSFDGVKLVVLFEPPVVIKKVPPTYPQAALRREAQGDVVLRLQINKEGTVDDVEVLEELPFGLTKAAIRAVKKWRFQPATSGGMTISSEIDVTVNFRL